MDKYKKSIFICFGALLVLLYGSIVIIWDFSFRDIIVSATTLLIMSLVFILLNIWMKRNLNPNVYPTNEWYRSHLERNFDFICYGDDLCNINFDNDKYKYFDLRLRKQDLLASFEVLKNTFSIIKPGGFAIFPLRISESLCPMKGIVDERLYYSAFRPYYFGKSKKKQWWVKISSRIPALLFKISDIYRIMKKENPDNQLKTEIAAFEKYSMTNIQQNLKALKGIIEDIKTFCIERNIIPLFVVTDKDNTYKISEGSLIDSSIWINSDVVFANNLFNIIRKNEED